MKWPAVLIGFALLGTAGVAYAEPPRVGPNESSAVRGESNARVEKRSGSLLVWGVEAGAPQWLAVDLGVVYAFADDGPLHRADAWFGPMVVVQPGIAALELQAGMARVSGRGTGFLGDLFTISSALKAVYHRPWESGPLLEKGRDSFGLKLTVGLAIITGTLGVLCPRDANELKSCRPTASIGFGFPGGEFP